MKPYAGAIEAWEVGAAVGNVKLELARQRRKEARESNPELFEDLKEAHHLSAD
jgi:hypothetical protein